MRQTIPARFFFYGTLMTGRNPLAARLKTRLRAAGRGTMPGELVWIRSPDLTYPGLVNITHPTARVEGIVMEPTPTFTLSDLNALHRWEDFNPQSPETSLYRLEDLPVTLEDGQVLRCATYLYQGPKKPQQA